MILASRREDDAPGFTGDPNFPPFDSSFEVIERDRKGGRKEREVESEMKRLLDNGGGTGENDEHKGDKSNQVTK